MLRSQTLHLLTEGAIGMPDMDKKAWTAQTAMFLCI